MINTLYFSCSSNQWLRVENTSDLNSASLFPRYTGITHIGAPPTYRSFKTDWSVKKTTIAEELPKYLWIVILSIFWPGIHFKSFVIKSTYVLTLILPVRSRNDLWVQLFHSLRVVCWSQSSLINPVDGQLSHLIYYWNSYGEITRNELVSDDCLCMKGVE